MNKRRLMLWRHAKSSWDDVSLDDFDRPLNERGKLAAIRMGRYMFDHDLLPDCVLCSSARRARDTFAALQPHLPHGIEVSFLDDLYYHHDYKDILLRYGKSATNLMVIAHNTALHTTALEYIACSDDAAGRDIRNKFPTGALAVIEWEQGRTSGFLERPGALISFVRPRDLIK